jgi:hypothetical protein
MLHSRTLKHVTIITALVLLSLSFDSDSRENTQTEPVSYKDTLLSAEQVSKDLVLLKTAYERLHPGYTRYRSEQSMAMSWDEISTTAQANKGMSVGQFYLAVQRTLATIGCDHTKANLPNQLIQARKTKPVYLPFKWVWLEDRAIVMNPGNAQEINKFDEVLSVDGVSIQDLVAQVLPLIPYDGYTTWSRQSGVADSLEFQGGALDHFGALMWDINEKVTLQLKDTAGELRTVTLNRLNYPEYLGLDGDKPSNANFKDAVSLKRIGDKAAVLTVDTFVNYRTPVKPQDIYEPIFKALADENRELLIVDLRKNGGGSSDASQGLLANLLNKKQKAKTDMWVNTLSFEDLRPHLWTWDKRALDPNRLGFSKNDDGTYSLRSWFTDELDTIKPTKYAFKGKIILLTSNSNSSGSTNLLTVIKSARDVITIGEKTGGSAEGPTAGVLFTLTLPESKITTRIPFFQYKNNVKEFKKGYGLSPDLEAPMTVDALIQGKDPAMEAALSYVDEL